jgi:hypothetical protein
MSSIASSFGALIAFAVIKLLFQATGAVYAHRCALHYSKGTAIRRAWTLLGMGPLAWFCGQLVLAIYSIGLRRHAPSPGPQDVFFVAGGVFVIVACFSFVAVYRASGFALESGKVDALVFAGTAAVLSLVGYHIVSTLLAAPGGTLQHVVDSTYPVLDLVMLAASILLLRMTLRFHGGKVWHVWAALIAGLVCATGGGQVLRRGVGEDHVAASVLIHVSFIVSYALFALGFRAQYRLVAS